MSLAVCLLPRKQGEIQMAQKKVTTTASRPTNTKLKQPKTVRLSTIVWSIVVLVALVAGFYTGVTARNAYGEAVNSEAKTLVKELKLNEQ